MSLETQPRFRRALFPVFVVLLLLFASAQFLRFVVPDFKLDNPPVTHSVEWNNPDAEQFWKASCADCHSNETVYPAYSYVAPIGWLVAVDVHAGRDELNISVDRTIDIQEMIEVIRDGEMPPPAYELLHSDAILSESEQQTLIDGIVTTFGGQAGSTSD